MRSQRLQPFPTRRRFRSIRECKASDLAGIGAGAGETQGLTVTATSGNQTLIPNASISVTYTSPAATGSVSFTAAAHQAGMAVITVTVQDNGGTAGGGLSSVTQMFTVTILPNTPPTIAATNTATFPEDSGPQSVNLTGITAGAGETQALTVTLVSSSNTKLIPFANLSIAYTSPASTASVNFTAAAHQVGSSVITVQVQDNGGTVGGGVDTVTQMFTITISPNVQPTLSAIPDPPAFPEDSPSHSVNLAGIGAGAGETQTLTVTATSGNTTLIPNGNIAVTYTSPERDGLCEFHRGGASSRLGAHHGHPCRTTAARWAAA